MRELQLLQAATTFSQECSPPRDRGTTWSRFSAGRLQYWQRWLSRAKTARRDNGTTRSPGEKAKSWADLKRVHQFLTTGKL